MRKTKWKFVLVAAVCALLGLGCAGDIGKQVMANPELQGKIMDLISQNSDAAGGMVDRLLGSDSTRAMVISKLMGSEGGAQAVMEEVAKNQTLIDGVLNLAVRDAATKDHIMTLLKGIKMGAGK